MWVYHGSHLVEDASGARFQIHEFRRRRLLSWSSRFELDGGESAKRIDRKSFAVAETGERLWLAEDEKE